MTKPYEISKELVRQAYRRVKANKGTAGVDKESLQAFEQNLENNLYKIWNRLSSGSYFPPAVKRVEIPKKSGGIRQLGVPTVSDRVAQMVVKLKLEPLLEPVFHEDSYGYRPGKSAQDAIGVVRQRCWEYDWLVEYDIHKFFDTISHELLMRALKKHCQIGWVLLYVQRWLEAPVAVREGEEEERRAGTPQGGVISPLLSNLFLHYAFDRWVSENLGGVPFCRYADDGVLHCKTRAQAELVLKKIRVRFEECGLELHPEKTRIVYCKDKKRQGNYPEISFTFLSYTFRGRSVSSRYGQLFVGFVPAASREAVREMKQTIRRWKLQLKNSEDLKELSEKYNPVLRGWMNYFGKFHRSALKPVWFQMNEHLVNWMMRKHKHLRRRKTKAGKLLRMMAESNPGLFVHWKFGILPMAG